MITVTWKYNKTEYTLSFATLDDAKTACQALWRAGYAAGYSVPSEYVEKPTPRYEGDGILSDSEMEELQKRINAMELVR